MCFYPFLTGFVFISHCLRYLPHINSLHNYPFLPGLFLPLKLLSDEYPCARVSAISQVFYIILYWQNYPPQAYYFIWSDLSDSVFLVVSTSLILMERSGRGVICETSHAVPGDGRGMCNVLWGMWFFQWIVSRVAVLSRSDWLWLNEAFHLSGSFQRGRLPCDVAGRPWIIYWELAKGTLSSVFTGRNFLQK